MKIRVISSREEILTLHSSERVVHLAFGPLNKDVFALVETFPKKEHYETKMQSFMGI